MEDVETLTKVSMAGERPRARIQEPVAEHTHTVIFLHGGGSDGPQLWRAINRMRPALFTTFPGFRWVFPSAALQWNTALEVERSQWFDANPRDSSGSLEHVPGLDASVRYLLELVDDELGRLGGRAERLVLGGISQGQATALHAFLCCRHKLGAFFGMSGWLPLAHKLQEMDMPSACRSLRDELKLSSLSCSAECSSEAEAEDDDNQGQGGGGGAEADLPPVFLGHGTYDRKVPLELARLARTVLQGMNMDVTWRQYVGAKIDGHWIKVPEELDDLIQFLQNKLKLKACDSDRPESEPSGTQNPILKV